MKKRILLLPLLPVLGVSCSQTDIFGISRDESWSVFSGLAALAKDADPGTETHACRFGGTVSVTTTVEKGEQEDSSWSSGRWVLEPSECRMIEDNPEFSVWQGSVTFETETSITREDARIRVFVDGHVNWSRSEVEGSVCPLSLDFESSFGTDDLGGLQGSADDVGICGRSWTVPLSMFPREPR